MRIGTIQPPRLAQSPSTGLRTPAGPRLRTWVRGVGVLTLECVGHLNAAPALRQVPFVDRLDPLEVLQKRDLERLGKQGDPVFHSLAVADENLVVAIGLFRTAAVVAGSQRLAKSIEQFRRSDDIGGFFFRDEDDFLPCL